MLLLYPNESLVRDFQRQRIGCDGKPLKIDGKIGPNTQWAIDVSLLCPLRQAIIYRALSYVGVTESPAASNRGTEIDEWESRVGLSGLPWCACFVSWCISLPELEPVNQASVAGLARLLPHVTEPLAGDVVYWLNANGTGHCGLLLGASGDLVMTVEGNSRDTVRVQTRASRKVKFLRSVPPQHMPGIPPGIEHGATETR